MRRSATSRKVAVLALALLLLATLAAAECPNGCSGNGACMAKDMCSCYKNYQGNDCADRTCLFGYAHVDTPKGDINMDQIRTTVGWILKDSQQAPAETYEYFNPSAKTNEAHFYMECSNKGVCDRETGTCNCFDGFEGSACHRTTCPAKCSGHGTCESIRELGAKAAGTLFGIEHPSGAVEYDLWDANSTYGCRCDPWYRGPDCSKRTCKVGVDPLYLSAGSARYETFVIHAWTTGTYPSSAWIRLRVFDYYGESYITTKIPILDDNHATSATATDNKKANALAVENALKAVPNLTFRDVACETTLAGTDYADFLSVRSATLGKGMSVICQYIDNPGKHRIPEVESFQLDTTANSFAKIVTTGVQGEDDDWFTKKSTLTATSIGATPFVALTVGVVTSTLAANFPTVFTPTLMKIGDDIVLATALDTVNSKITLGFSYTKTFGTAPPIFLQGSYTAPTAINVIAALATSAVTAVGDTKLTFAKDPRITVAFVAEDIPNSIVGVAASQAFATGNQIFFHNQFFYVQQIYPDAVTANTFYAVLDKPFGGSSKDGGSAAIGDVPYLVTLPDDKSLIYNYVSPCSGRGLCGTDSGLCTCFKGYTNDNCNTQNILAL